MNVSERRGAEHASSAAGGTGDGDSAVCFLLLQAADQHSGPQLLGKEVNPKKTAFFIFYKKDVTIWSFSSAYMYQFS